MSTLFSKNSIEKFCQILVVFIFVAFSGISPVVMTAEAQGTPGSTGAYTLLEPLPCISSGNVADEEEQYYKCPPGTLVTSPDFETYVQYVFNLAIALAAVSAVFMIVWGGFEYMTSEAPGVKNDGLKKVKNAIYGLLLVLCSYLILRTIDPRLVAIPSTLVPPLVDCAKTPNNVLCKHSATSDFLTQIAAEAAAYQLQGQKFVEDAQAAKAKVTQLQLQKQDLLATRATLTTAGGVFASSDPAVLNIDRQVANIDNQIQSAQVGVAESLTKSIIDNGGVSGALRNIDTAHLDGSVTADYINKQVADNTAFIDKTVKTRTDQLKQLGEYDEASKPGGIVDYGNKEKFALQIAGINSKIELAQPTKTFSQTFLGGIFASSNEVDVYVGEQYIGKVNQVAGDFSSQINAVTKQVDTIKDPVLKQELQDKIKASQAALDKKFPKK